MVTHQLRTPAGCVTSEPKNRLPVKQVAWTINEWCDALRISRGEYYRLKLRYPDILHDAHIGRATRVVTSPEDFLQALAALEEEKRQALLGHNSGPPMDSEPMAPLPQRGRGRPRKYPPVPPHTPHQTDR